jgi:hypothetical protein
MRVLVEPGFWQQSMALPGSQEAQSGSMPMPPAKAARMTRKTNFRMRFTKPNIR